MIETPDYDSMEDDALEHRYQIDWALRVLICRKRGCRRSKACRTQQTCPGLAVIPIPKAIEGMRLRRVRRLLEERYNAIEAGPEADAALKRRWQEEARCQPPRPDYRALARKELETGVLTVIKEI